MSPTAVLVGLPGTGKSSTGRRLAKILDVPFADSDELVHELTGLTVRELFDHAGEDAFRRVEIDAIDMALRQFHGVLALGGGALTARETRAALRASGVPVVLLQASIETLCARVGDGRTRPLLAGHPETRLLELAQERTPVYERVASMAVDTDGHTPGQVASTVAARLHERGAPR